MQQKGFRQPAQASKKAQVNALTAEVQNLSMSVRISQMLLQQMLTNVKTMGEELAMVTSQSMEMSYKVQAMQKHFNLDSAELDKIANVQRLKDFDEAAEKADKRENLLTGDVVSEDSTITITSTAVDLNGKDAGIFRSRLKLGECGVPALITALTGAKVGDKATLTLNNAEHTVEVLAIRNPAPDAIEAVTAEVSH